MRYRELIPFQNACTTSSARRRNRPFEFFGADLDKIFESFLRETPLSGSSQQFEGFHPEIDVEETDEAINVKVYVPEIKKDEIDLSLTREALTISGERKIEEKSEKNGRRYFESRFGRFQRSLPLNCEIDSDAVRAEKKDGVLTIVLPKASAEKNGTRSISISE